MSSHWTVSPSNRDGLFTLNNIFFKKRIIDFFICAHGYAFVISFALCAWRLLQKPEDVLFLLVLELQVVASYQTWVLGTDHRSSAKASRALNC